MSTVDLKEALTGFFSSYLMEQKQVSLHTLKSYRDTFKFLLTYIQREKRLPQFPTLDDFDIQTLLGFLKNLEDDKAGRGNMTSTRNLRLAAINSFFKYLSWQHPTLERQADKVRGIPRKKSPIKKLDFLTHEELHSLFAQVDPRTSDGFRDLALLTYLYNTGARSQEAADTRISWVDFSNGLAHITGKGNKQRSTPLWGVTLTVIRTYLEKHRRKPFSEDFLFINQRGKRLTRFGVRGIVKKYLEKTKTRCPGLQAKRLSTHSLRHTTAMHLLESGVEQNVIKAWLGHADIRSTERYLNADLKHKKEALAKFAPPIYVVSSLDQKSGTSTENLLGWLKDL